MTINELECFFNSIELPDQIQVGKAVRITNVRNFIETNLLRSRRYGTNPTFGTSYDDLITLKDLLLANADKAQNQQG